MPPSQQEFGMQTQSRAFYEALECQGQTKLLFWEAWEVTYHHIKPSPLWHNWRSQRYGVTSKKICQKLNLQISELEKLLRQRQKKYLGDYCSWEKWSRENKLGSSRLPLQRGLAEKEKRVGSEAAGEDSIAFPYLRSLTYKLNTGCLKATLNHSTKEVDHLGLPSAFKIA